jgi:pimeloyl-ACP methyl ester carboxylesterase
VIKTIAYKNGSLLSYVDDGDPNGYPILIQHGLIASIRGQQLFKSLLDAGARPISIARPGYGESSPYEMKNVAEWGGIVSVLVDALALSQFDVFGISSGAPYSYALAYQFPQQVRNLFILSGTPALYDEEVQACWPYPLQMDAAIPAMQQLAHELFFSHLGEEDLQQDEIRDSLRNSCFGIALDLRIRCMDWGFNLSQLKTPVKMRHSRADTSVPLLAAERTARLLPNCRLDVREDEPHFSEQILDDFIHSTILL